MKHQHIIVLLLTTFFLIPNTYSQKKKKIKANIITTLNRNDPGLFGKRDVIDVKIYTDLKKLFSDVSDSAKYHRAILEYTNPDSTTTTLKVKARTRGNFRRKPTTCNLPPIKLKISKKQSKGSIFEGYKELKIVNQCRLYRANYQEYLFQEYLIYEYYTLLTQFSLRVRLMRITYIDTTDDTQLSRFAFFIEPEENMALRNHSEVIKTEDALPEDLRESHLTMLSLFEFMIMNTDFSIPLLHNIRTVKPDNSDRLIAVPYDFDWSEIINIPYRYNQFTIDEDKIPKRIYTGNCPTEKTIKEIVRFFNIYKNSIKKLNNEFDYLSEQTRKQNNDHISDFYKIINSPRQLRKNILTKCKKP